MRTGHFNLKDEGQADTCASCLVKITFLAKMKRLAPVIMHRVVGCAGFFCLGKIFSLFFAVFIIFAVDI